MAEISCLDSLAKELTCSVCLDQYTNPKTLPCLHSFCLKCIEALLPTEVSEELIQMHNIECMPLNLRK